MNAGQAILVMGGLVVMLAMVTAWMIRLDRVNRRRIQRRRDAWKAAGGVGTCPGDETSFTSYGM